MKRTHFLSFLPILMICACMNSAHAQSTLQSTAFADDAWGVYSWASYDSRNVTREKCPYIKGAPLILKWNDLEPENGKFRFNEEIREKLEQLDENDFNTFLMVWVAPATNTVSVTDTSWSSTPKWLFNNGVPLVEFPPTVNPLGASTTRYFPYYLDEDYKFYFHRMIDSLGNYICNLPPNLKKRVLYLQSAEGSTGDGQPYKGEPINPVYDISKAQWSQFRIETWEKYKSAFTREGELQIPLLTNYDSNEEEQYRWMLDSLPKAIGLKNGMFSHGYHISDAQERLAVFINFRNAVEAAGKTFFARGEMDAEYDTYGWSTQNKPQALYWSAIYATYGGLTMWNVPSEACEGETYADAIHFFNRYTAQTNPATAKGAFSAFRRGLDASDTEAFPESVYGTATKDNTQRYINIANAFSEYGANQGDPEKATGGGMINRKREDYNDVGWQIFKENYHRHITQIDPEETSAAWWQIDTSVYGRFARGFNPAVPAKNSMYFDLDDKFFGDSPLNGSQAIRVAITYRDSDPGSWELMYDATNGTMKSAMAVTNSGTGTDVWKTQKVTLYDAYLGNRGAKSSDFILVNQDGTACRFHMIAVDKTAAVDGVSISNCPWFNIPAGSVYQLMASVSPANASDPRVSWSSSDTTVVKVDANGAIETIVEGSAIITVTTSEGGFTDECTINVGIPDEVYSIINRASGQKIKPAGYNVGDYIVQTPASDETTLTKWTKEMVDDTYYYLKNVETGMYFRPITSDIASLMEQRPTTDVDDWVQWTDITAEGSYVYLVHKETGNYIRPVTGDDNSPIELRPTSRTGNWTQWLLQAEWPQVQNVTGISISGCPPADLIEGDPHQLSATVSPVDATDQSVSWSSSNTSVASVSNAGLVTALAAGSAEISVTTNDSGFSETCKIDVVKALVPVNGISISGCPGDSLSMGGTYQLEVVISPDDADDQEFSWSSSNTSVARIDANGIITAIAEGNSTISVISNDGSFTDECIVAVKDTMTTLIEFNKYNSDISVYLNPVSKELNITFSKTDQQRELKIFNSMGALLLAEEVIDLKKTVNIKKLKMHGLVIIQIKTGRDVFTKKVMVN